MVGCDLLHLALGERPGLEVACSVEHHKALDHARVQGRCPQTRHTCAHPRVIRVSMAVTRQWSADSATVSAETAAYQRHHD
eukprot:3009605-Rhodomonas_salina.1